MNKSLEGHELQALSEVEGLLIFFLFECKLTVFAQSSSTRHKTLDAAVQLCQCLLATIPLASQRPFALQALLVVAVVFPDALAVLHVRVKPRLARGVPVGCNMSRVALFARAQPRAISGRTVDKAFAAGRARQVRKVGHGVAALQTVYRNNVIRATTKHTIRKQESQATSLSHTTFACNCSQDTHHDSFYDNESHT